MDRAINKSIRELAKNSNYTLQTLQKQLNFIKKEEKKSIERSSDTGVVSDTSDTGVVSDTSNLYHFRHVSQGLQTLFEDSLGEKVLKHFYTTKNIPISIVNLAIILGENKGSLRAAINRRKEFFSDTGVKGKAGVIQLIQVGIDEINSRIDSYEKKLEYEKELKDKQQKVQEIENNFQNEIRTFVRNHKPKREGEIIYLDFNELLSYDPVFADSLLDDPKRFIDTFSSIYDNKLDVQILNFPSSRSLNIEEIREKHINKIISVEGRVTSFGEVKPVIKSIKFECPSCGVIINIQQNYRIGLLRYPSRCSCGRKGGFEEIERIKINACFVQFSDLQDNTDNPHSQRMKAVLFNKLTEPERIKIFNPGNEIRCIAILKEVPIFKNSQETLFPNLILEIISAELIDKDVEVENLSDEDMLKINELSAKIDLEGMDIVLNSFSPEVYGYNEIKGAMILQLCNMRNEKKKKAVRNKSNILLIGDPGVAKSVLGDFAMDISSGARKAVGGGSSAVGLTASVVKEEDSLGGYRVEPGALILAKDLLFIDELNNLTDEDKPKLQEGMNEQTVSINKANLHVQMKVTAGIIAVANPKNGHFTEGGKESMDEQFNIPSPILNRFDSVFVVRDIVEDANDKKITEKMIKRHRGIIKPLYDKSFLKKFFAYIKHLDEPEIDNEMELYLQEIYSKARKVYKTGVKINPRFLESLIRMCTSSAKLRQSKNIEIKDVNVALHILSKSQYNVPETINIEIDKK